VNNVVVKVGGNELDDDQFMDRFLKALARQTEPRPVLVHGGGKEIAQLQKRLGLEPAFVDGLRVTDAASLEVAEMVLCGLINKRLVARLVVAGARAIGLCGVDLGVIRVEKLVHPAGDLGFVGAIKSVDAGPLQVLLEHGYLPVISPISLAWDGTIYNVNADHAALAVAVALGAVALYLVTNVPGVLVEGQVLPRLDSQRANELIANGTISGGMVPKVRAAIEAVLAGVPQVRITDVAGFEELVSGRPAGTVVVA
jgi:acetylglutamate kinase